MCFALCVQGQSRRERIKWRADSVLSARYRKAASYDTAYIGRPNARLTLKARANISGNSIRARGMVNGADTRASLSTDHKATLSVGLNYLGVTAGLTVNPSSLRGKNKDYEVNVNAYSNRYSIDASYQMSKTLAGTVERGGLSHYVDRGVIDMKMLNVAGYYTFNHRRFSYPAAFTQSYIQKRSAGSWLAGFSYQGGSMKTTADAPAAAPSMRIYVGHFGIGAGYGYNLVAGRRWLFHVSALPTIVLFNRNNITISGERRRMATRFPDMIFNHRVAIVHNFNDRHFCGATFVMSNTMFNDDDIDISQNKWRARAFLGVRF